jgi:peptide/nickel transport system permease protein
MKPLALTLCLLIIAATAAAPWLAPYDPTTLGLHNILAAPSSQHWLGTDALGRDILSRLLYGARVSLAVGVVAIGVATASGLAVGALAALGSRWLDALLMRATDVMLCFPAIFLLLAAAALLPPSLLNLMLIIGLTGWMGIARLTRAELLKLKHAPFMDAARLAGTRPLALFAGHLLPHLWPLVLTTLSLGLAGAILTEAALSFLGLGVQPPTASWGTMLADGKPVMEVAWWLTVCPGLAILVTVLAFTLLGETLNPLRHRQGLQKS